MGPARVAPASLIALGGVALLSVAASVLRTVAGGQDLNFDLVAYHFYTGHSLFQERLALDFMAAGGQGYQPPLPYALLAALDRAGVPPLASAVLHACLHALNLVALLVLARQLSRGTPAEGDRLLVALFWLAGAIAPVYWSLVGTSFADLPTSALVLGGLAFAAASLPAHGAGAAAPGRLALGALLAGAAAGLRPHNGIFVVAIAGALLLLRFPDRKEKLRAFALFGGVAAAAGLVCLAPHAWSLYRHFGNPVFPFFNGVFRSPDFLPVDLPLTGFVPSSLIELLALPLRMATYRQWVYAEVPLPDVRPAVLAAAALAAALVWTYRRQTAPPSPQRSLVMLFFALALLLWLATSANGRYGVALLLLAGPVCGVLLQRVLPRRYVLAALGGILLWQGALHETFFKQSRYASGHWSGRYFDWNLPPELVREPATYLSFGFQTASSLAARVHPASRHLNLVGQVSIDIDQPGARRVRQMIDAPDLPLYGVFDFYYTQQQDPAARSIKRYFAEHLQRWGLDFAEQPCSLVAFRDVPVEWHRVDIFFSIYPRGNPPRLIVCALRPAAARDREAALERYRRFERTLGPLLVACPRLLDPRSISIVRVHGQWLVSSLATLEYRLEVDDEGNFAMQMMRPPYAIARLGKLGAGGVATYDADCATWFARLAR